MHVPIFISRPSRLLPLAILATCCGVHAQEQSATMPDVVVTATRADTPTVDIGASTSVLTGQELEKLGVVTVLEAFRSLPGVQVIQSGGPGKQASVFLRGHESRHTLVLIDGMRVNNPAVGGYDFGGMTVNRIARIEIVRGPQSMLYGSDAIGGVINIITHSGQESDRGEIAVEAGNLEYSGGHAQWANANEWRDFSLHASLRRSDGVSAADEDNGNDEEDEWTNLTLGAKFGFDTAHDGHLDLAANYRESENDLDSFVYGVGFADNQNYTSSIEHLSLSANFSLPVTDWYTQKVILGYSSSDMRDRDPDESWNEADILTETLEGTLLAELRPHESDTLALGYTHTREDVDSSGNYDESRETDSVFAENVWAFAEGSSLSAGIRHDDVDGFGNETTLRLAGAYALPFSNNTRLHASWGTGFKAPNLNDLYWPASGNPDLDAEESRSYDLGIEQTFLDGRAVADVTYFNSEVEDLISWAPVDPADPWGPWQPFNVDDAAIEGLEFTLSAELTEKVGIRANYTHTQAEDANTGDRLIRRAKHTGSVVLDWQVTEKADLTATVLHVGKRYEDAANTTELDAYTRLDLAGRMDLKPGWTVYARIENLFDEDIEEAMDYGTAGIFAYGGLRVSF